MIRAVALALTFLTGLAGLVYQVTWQRYLAVLLGSHAEATASVLGLFLGGLAGGYALFGALCRKRLREAAQGGAPPRLLEFYGAVEVAIGAWALAFPLLFHFARAVSVRLPETAPGPGFALDVALCALLLLPPTLLMGGTIPLLTQALSRSPADATRMHALVYASNSAGAFAGALLAGFWLIAALGLPGTLTAMAALNLGAGALFIALGRRTGDAAAPAEGEEARAPLAFPAYAAAALASGFAMMTLEVVAIRIGGLSFGSSEYAFSMVVAVFVASIALGSLLVTLLPRLPGSLLLANQCLLVAALTALYSAVPRAPLGALALRIAVSNEDTAFALYYAAAFALAGAALAPALVLSGASLPLVFDHLRRRYGELGSAAGRLYSWNTVGSLLGALGGGYALLFWLDLHHVYRIAVAALALAALCFAFAELRERGRRAPLVAAALALAPLQGWLALAPAWPPGVLSAGLFRLRANVPGQEPGAEAALRRQLRDRRLLFYDDDPGATVSVVEFSSTRGKPRGLFVNGKPDSSTAQDTPTTVLLGVLPALFSSEARRAFVIGYGTGVSAGELASLESIEEVVVAEISPAVVAAAPHFDAASRGASSNPKIRITRSDAYRALQRSEGGFDVIASEPSNPWVTGVEMLYTREFLEAARAKLAPGGVFCQWFHQYELDDASLELVLRSFDRVFEHAALWYGGGPDLFLLGFSDPASAQDLPRVVERARRPDYQRALLRAELPGLGALFAHELWPEGVLRALALEGEVQTLLHPRLAQLAGRAFFRGDDAKLPFTGFGTPAAIGARNALLPRFLASLPAEQRGRVRAQAAIDACRQRSANCLPFAASYRAAGADAEPDQARLAAAVARAAGREPGFGPPLQADTVTAAADLFAAPEDAGGSPRPRIPLARLTWLTDLYLSTYHPALPYRPEALDALWARCAGNPEACSAGARRARDALAGRRAAPGDGRTP